MPKKQAKQQHFTTAQTFKIHKNKSLLANLNEYIRHLRSNHSNLTTKQYLNLMHKYVFKLKEVKGGIPQSLVVETTSKIKICKQCDKWAIGAKKMIQCILCEDNYHLSCIEGGSEPEWACKNCEDILEKWENENVLAKKKEVPICSKCSQNKNQHHLKCLKCFSFFHKSCYGDSPVVCQDCHNEIRTKIDEKYTQLTLGESFKRAQVENSKKKLRKTEVDIKLESNKSCLVKFGTGIKSEKPRETREEAKKQIIDQSTRSGVISTLKKFSCVFPAMTAQEIEKYRQSLLFAIMSKNMEYTEELFCNNCSLDIENEDSVDFALTHLSYSDLKIFKEYKKQPIGPFLLHYKEKCGYDVVADRNLPKGMIVCEYVGDVFTSRSRIRLCEENDSVMELRKGKNADESLLIVPRKYTNIARFINGVNENDAIKLGKQNVETVRYLVNGRPAVILYTSRPILKGESLLYNYGAGLNEKKYDTSYYE